jgi:hypothetical protein
MPIPRFMPRFCLAARGHPGRSGLHVLRPLEDFGAGGRVAAAAAWKAALR